MLPHRVIRCAPTLTVLLIVGCSGDDSAPLFASTDMISCPSTTEAVQSQILAPSCGAVGCHGSTSPALDLDLTAPGLVQRLAGRAPNGCGDQTLLVPGLPERSYLIDKVVQAEPACGERMPLGGEPLAAAKVECLRQWIRGLGASGSAGAAGQSNAAGTGSGGTAQQSAGGSGGASGAANASAAATNGGGSASANGGAAASVSGGSGSGGAATGAAGSSGALNSSASSGGATASAGAPASAGGQVGCGPAVSFSSQVQPIFTANCASAGCHTGARPAGKLTLAAGASYAALVNVAASCSGRVLVKPSAVSESYLMDKLLGRALCTGSQMPKAGSSLPSAALSAISGWICEGAPKN